METIRSPMAEYGVAKFVLPGEGESGDQHLVCCNENGILVAAIDGIGHGAEAANAAKAATAVLRNGIGEPIISLVTACHEKLRSTRGVRNDFAGTLSALENPQRAADRILKGFSNGSDDALVLALRITGIHR